MRPLAALALLPLVGLHGLGPLRIGMLRPAAVDTGWIAHRGQSCPYGGHPYPYDYGFTSQAPRGVNGSVEFNSFGMLEDLLLSGVRTATGVVVDRTPWFEMVHRYRRAGFAASARLVNGNWRVTIRRHPGGPPVMQAYQGVVEKAISIIAVPGFPDESACAAAG